MFSQAELLLSLVSSKSSNVGDPVFVTFFVWAIPSLVWDLTASFQRVIARIGSKNSGSGPFMQIQIKVLKIFPDSDDLPSILICFIRENICSTLAFDTGSENNNSSSNRTRFHKTL